MKITDIITEAASPAQQAAIAKKKKAGMIKEQQLDEFAPLLALGARLFMAAAPKIAQVVGRAGQAGARGAGQAARAGTEIAAKNAGKIGMGAGAYEIGSSVADIAKDIAAKVGTAIDEKTLLDLSALAFKYAIPAGIVLAVLYGGKKAIDSLFDDPKDQQGVAEATGDEKFDKMMTTIKQGTNKQKTADRKEQKKQTQQRARDAFGNMFGGGNPADKLSIRKDVSEELAEEFDLIESIVEMIAEHNGVDAEVVWADLESLTEDELYVFAVTSDPLMEDWQKANKRDKTDGMSQKAVNAYRRENPGSKLKTAVTTKPSKLKKGGKASKRRKSYCSRSRGPMKMHSISCAKTPDKAICKARRRWNC